MLNLYNTLTKRVEGIEKKDHLNLYTCGPTVYNFAHIGNLRSYIEADLLYRTLKADGYNPRWVMNITDIDDKTIKGAIAEYGPTATVEDLRKYTGKYYQAFLNDLREVNVLVDEIRFVKVTDVVTEIQEFIVELINKGYAYKAEDGSTYFSIEHYQEDFHDYGKLVGEKFIEGKKVGARVKVDEYDKDNLSDFALWKARDEADAQIFWEHPILGEGRPGWHIECSVINRVAFNGEPTDIHTGGVDLIFPHHTNEIAQSQPVYRPFVNHWSHCEHLQVDGKKMSKSLGNVYTLNDLKAKGFSGADFRYFLLSSSYGNQQNFTWEALLAAHNALQTLHERFDEFAVKGHEQKDVIFDDKRLAKHWVPFDEAITDNINTPKALAEAWETVRDDGIFETDKFSSLKVYDEILGLGLLHEPMLEVEIPETIKKMMDDRQRARDNKDFVTSDHIRNEIETLGYEVMDTPEGQKVRKKISI